MQRVLVTREASIVELAAWLQTPPGRYLLAWEQAQLDAAVVDLFGFHALQLGLPELQGLRANRMPHRWLALDNLAQNAADWHASVPADEEAQAGFSQFGLDTQLADRGVALFGEFDALPFEANSLDLVLLPHTLELASDPHRTLREVERVLRPEGRLVISGINPASAWGLRQNLGRLVNRLPGSGERLYLPRAGDFIGYWRLRDWLRLLSFEVEGAQFGGYCPPLRSDKWLKRWDWLEGVGSRWWPVLGAVYFLTAVKRVHGMRLIGLARQPARPAKARAAVALHQHHKHREANE
ncbi:class I SAM-dependent methyltransferase [Paucibacter sp. O1-1]|nr:class I SAM-dependent methyltransferase [Paucibacter sp. M5-1]MCU7371400.1 class I SAM-dependent methyltransferase [Paucibacter sp. O1-1]MCZ7883261.1 class I SAM-dependent methyltransferase [Paucibacter sp. M5-1]MDA3826389.1 class I SAM-dependent methyltransferase [Paucibacter sp. O1-1]